MNTDESEHVSAEELKPSPVSADVYVDLLREAIGDTVPGPPYLDLKPRSNQRVGSSLINRRGKPCNVRSPLGTLADHLVRAGRSVF